MRLVVSDPHPATCHGCSTAGETIALRVQAADGQWGAAEFCRSCAAVIGEQLLTYGLRRVAPVPTS